jgi:hypothetical protein
LEGKLSLSGSVPILDSALGKRLRETFTLESRRLNERKLERTTGIEPATSSLLFGEKLPRIC